MYSIAHLILKADFQRTWQEAVAVVVELASMADGLPSIPGPGDLLLSDDGTLVMGFASEDASDPVAAAGHLLLALLEGTDAPPALRAIAEESAGPSPRYKSLAAFRAALEFYERPGRPQVLAGLAERLRRAGTEGVDVEQDTELERLRAKVAEPHEPTPGTSEKRKGSAPLRRAPSRWKRRVAAAVAAAAVVGAGGALAWRAPELLDSARAALKTPAPDIVLAGDVPAGRKDSSAGSAVARRAGSTTPARGGPPASVAATLTGGREFFPIGSMGVSDLPLTPLPRGIELPGGLNAPVVVVAGEAPPAERVYTAADPEVEPPVLLRRQLPTGVKPTPSDTGYFDLVVDEAGRVELVRLVSPTKGYHERMLMAAAKAWLFEPARLHGQPVRFQVRIPITIRREW